MRSLLRQLTGAIGRPPARPEYHGAARQIGFIVGTGRCGTTILSQVLNSHSRICVPPETQILVSAGNTPRLYDEHLEGRLSSFTVADLNSLVDRCCPYRLEEFFDYRAHFAGLPEPPVPDGPGPLLRALFDHMCHAHGKDVLLEQTPWHGQRLNILAELFPDLRVIHMVRDGRDVSLSFARTPWWSDDPAENLERWAREMAIIETWGGANPNRFLMVRYEDLVTDPRTTLTGIVEFLDLAFEEGILDIDRLIDYSPLFKAEILKNRKRPAWSDRWQRWNSDRRGRRGRELFFTDGLYSWRRHQPADLFSPHRLFAATEISAVLARYGYEPLR